MLEFALRWRRREAEEFIELDDFHSVFVAAWYGTVRRTASLDAVPYAGFCVKAATECVYVCLIQLLAAKDQ